MTTSLAPVPSDALIPDHLHSLLSVRDLTDPATGPHAVQVLLGAAVDALAGRWHCPVELRRPSPLVAVEDNYDRLGHPRSSITRASRYTRYVSDTAMLRSHTSAGVPPALRRWPPPPVPPRTCCLSCPA